MNIQSLMDLIRGYLPTNSQFTIEIKQNLGEYIPYGSYEWYNMIQPCLFSR